MRKLNPEWLNRPRKHGNPEGHIQLQIIHYCKARGWIIGKIKNKGSRIGKSFILDPYAFLGLPDLLLFKPEMIFIEVKSATGKQSEYQKSFQDLCQQSAVKYVLVKSLDEFISAIA